jgi:hypothetical protein
MPVRPLFLDKKEKLLANSGRRESKRVRGRKATECLRNNVPGQLDMFVPPMQRLRCQKCLRLLWLKMRPNPAWERTCRQRAWLGITGTATNYRLPLSYLPPAAQASTAIPFSSTSSNPSNVIEPPTTSSQLHQRCFSAEDCAGYVQGTRGKSDKWQATSRSKAGR